MSEQEQKQPTHVIIPIEDYSKFDQFLGDMPHKVVVQIQQILKDVKVVTIPAQEDKKDDA
jgi:hypothetical protein